MFLEVPDSLFAVIPAVQDLLNMAAAQLSLPSETAAIGQPDFERAVRDHTMAIERSVHASVFRSLDMDVEGLVVGAQRYRRSHRAKLEVLTMAGARLGSALETGADALGARRRPVGASVARGRSLRRTAPGGSRAGASEHAGAPCQ